MPFKNYQTYVRIVNPASEKTPLILLHGGPGSTHNSFELFDSLAKDDNRTIIMYDQLGCGKSIIKGDYDPKIFNKDTWLDELDNIRNLLHLDNVHILGHSFGGMLAIMYLCDKNPKGVKSVILSSTLSSASLWEEETHKLISLMDKKDQEIIKEAEESDDFDNEEIKEVLNEYYHRYVFGPFKEGVDPECLLRKKEKNKEVYISTWGKSEFAPSGNLKDYEYTDKLNKINCPVLICNGAFDESTPYQNKVIYDSLKCEKYWYIYQHSRHMSYYEEKNLYQKRLKEFLDQH